MRLRTLVVVVSMVAMGGMLSLAQGQKPASPAGTAATQIGGKYVPGKMGQTYQDGKWIEVTYGRPIKRGRQDLFGAGTLIFSNWPAQQNYDPKNKAALWGSYGYTPDQDVLRVGMKVDVLPFS